MLIEGSFICIYNPFYTLNNFNKTVAILNISNFILELYLCIHPQ